MSPSDGPAGRRRRAGVSQEDTGAIGRPGKPIVGFTGHLSGARGNLEAPKQRRGDVETCPTGGRGNRFSFSLPNRETAGTRVPVKRANPPNRATVETSREGAACFHGPPFSPNRGTVETTFPGIPDFRPSGDRGNLRSKSITGIWFLRCPDETHLRVLVSTVPRFAAQVSTVSRCTDWFPRPPDRETVETHGRGRPWKPVPPTGDRGNQTKPTGDRGNPWQRKGDRGNREAVPGYRLPKIQP